MRILVSGTRRATVDEHGHLIGDALQLAAWGSTRLPGPHVLVHGDAPGADRIAAGLARTWGWSVETRPAAWETHGRAAGPIRNGELVAAGADLVLAFPSTTDSPGTWDLIRKAAAARMRVNICPLRIEEATLL